MDIVSFETAKQLKEAGFPQPETGLPHIWYATSDFLGADGEVHEAVGMVISMLGYMAMPYVVPLGFNEKVEIGKWKYKEFFYAPSAVDILDKMTGFTLYRRDASWHVYPPDGDTLNDWEDTIAAESAALAWLSVNAIKFSMTITGKTMFDD